MKAFIFDRDGTLNIDTGYIKEPSKMELIPGIKKLLLLLKSKKYLIFVLTNQSGIGRKLIKPSQYRDVNQKFQSLIGKNIIDEILYCPHHVKDNCSCRKPKILLLEILKENYNIDFKKSYFVGDKNSDISCGKNFNMKTIMILNNKNTDSDNNIAPDYSFNSIKDLIDFLS